ncbi:hypothetical protein BDZ89DRAFT_1073672 [Hymenopellis radicata]|nr:hypothetical protein BDZ89DRAFT_1073672 [Hymenopellis radicata]
MIDNPPFNSYRFGINRATSASLSLENPAKALERSAMNELVDFPRRIVNLATRPKGLNVGTE